MAKFDDYPKSLKKTLRYIKQDAPLAQLSHIETEVLNSIKNRKEALEKVKKVSL
ncbi:hypothetical protein [Peribacillus simplex]|uniref:hypothetical protein n=1 Tax=Peribacillus simplex TaxID=1478 RepID=UPI0028536B40|nr:hypothetical protein [Peribacillus simplex]MDR4925431.1 hypothetical protein [Peribacillus simplex]